MSLTERHRYAAPHRTVALTKVRETISDIDRILALPKREPIICERDPRTGKFPPITQALIEVMTARFSRGQRLSCACRERKVVMQADRTLVIGRVLPEEFVPEPPLMTTVEAFIADNRSPSDAEDMAVNKIRAMKPGDTITLPSADTVGHPCIKVLNAVQSWFLFEVEQCDGGVGLMGVGCGKSASFLLAPLLFPDSRLAALLIEPKQRQHYRSQYLRLREHFRVPSLVPDDNGPSYTVPGTTPVHLISYSVLSLTKNSDLLDTKSPDVLLGDEFHRACGDSAINRRVKKYIASKIKEREEAIVRGERVRKRAVRLIGASGTMEAGSIEDTQMPCTFALGMGSPLPIDPNEARRWSMVIDPSRDPDRKSDTAKTLQRVFAGKEFDEADVFNNLVGKPPESEVRKGFRRRRALTPGIISASASAINASIYLTERKPPKMPKAVYDALMKVRVEGMRPDGEYLVDEDDASSALKQITCARNVSCGFYQYWAFPNHPCTCEKLATGEVINQCGECELIERWYAKRKTFNKELRSKLRDGETFLDSKKLCELAAERFWGKTNDGPLWECMSWPAWRDIEDEVEYQEREKWIENGGDFLVNDAADWASKNKGVIWFQSTTFGRRLAEITGLPYFNGGPGAEQRMRAEKGDRSIICSIKAHGAGTDGLQMIFNKQLITETPASNSKQTGYEQLLGRLHREGQPKPEVFTEVYLHVVEMKDALRKAIYQAEFNFEMQGSRQKLLMADKDIDGL